MYYWFSIVTYVTSHMTRMNKVSPIATSSQTTCLFNSPDGFKVVSSLTGCFSVPGLGAGCLGSLGGVSSSPSRIPLIISMASATSYCERMSESSSVKGLSGLDFRGLRSVIFGIPENNTIAYKFVVNPSRECAPHIHVVVRQFLGPVFAEKLLKSLKVRTRDGDSDPTSWRPFKKLFNYSHSGWVEVLDPGLLYDVERVG